MIKGINFIIIIFESSCPYQNSSLITIRTNSISITGGRGCNIIVSLVFCGQSFLFGQINFVCIGVDMCYLLHVETVYDL